MSERAQGWLRFAVQGAMSFALALVVARQIDLRQIGLPALSLSAFPWLMAALLLFNLSRLAGALRLDVYQRHAGIHLHGWENLRLTYAGMFLSLFLPGGIGGDGYRILVLRRRKMASVKTLVHVLLADRAGGMLILLFLLMLLCVLTPVTDLLLAKSGMQVLCIAVICGLAAVSPLMHRGLLGMRLRPLAAVCAYGFAVQILQLACMGALLAWIRIPANQAPAYLAVFLASSVAAAVPVTVGGLGARELTFLYGLQMLEIDATPGVLASSGFFLITAISALPGAMFLKDPATRERLNGAMSRQPCRRDERTPDGKTSH
jgi:uncharacterized membrane protein YbhN (UPF0104 family)